MLHPREFKQVFNQPIRSSDPCFRVLARVNGKQHHRLGMAVSKKACSKAVGRNRIKRLVRESFRTQQAGQVSAGNLDFVVLPTAWATNQSNETLVKSLSVHWQKVCRKAEDSNDNSPKPNDG